MKQNREEIIQTIESLKEEAIRRGFDYPRDPPLTGETTETLRGFLGDIKHFLHNEREFDRRHKKGA
jgi:hypothetical protein